MNKLKIIIIREFLSKIRNRTFIRMTFISPLIMVALMVTVAYVTKSSMEKVREIAYIDQSGLFDKEKDFQSNKSLIFHDLTGQEIETALKAVQKSGQYGLLYIPAGSTPEEIAKNIRFYSEKPPGINFTERLESVLSRRLTEIRMKEMALDLNQYKNAKVKVSLQLQTPGGENTSKLETGLKFGIGSAAGYFLFLFIVVYGAMVMRSVIEEKTGRIIEIIVSSVKPFQLMMGKVLGTGLAGILQFIIWTILLILLYSAAIPFFGLDKGMQAGQMQAVARGVQQNATPDKIAHIFQVIHQLPLGMIFLSFILFFTGGFLLYASLYAAIGAAVDSETDTQQFMMPIMLPLMLGIYVGFAVIANDPHGNIATIFSLIPFTSPVVMMMRIPLGAPLWQIVLSLVILYLTFIFMIWIAGKIYRVGILSYGKKPTYKDLFKWLKYS